MANTFHELFLDTSVILLLYATILDENKTMENCEHHWKSKQQVLRSTLTLKNKQRAVRLSYERNGTAEVLSNF